MKDYNRNKESYLKYQDINNLYDWAMLQKLLVNDFEWIKNTSKFTKDFIISYYEESDEGYLIFSILKNYMNFILIYHFYQKI